MAGQQAAVGRRPHLEGDLLNSYGLGSNWAAPGKAWAAELSTIRDARTAGGRLVKTWSGVSTQD